MSAMGDGRLSRNGSDYLDGNRQTSSRGRPDLLFSSACIGARLSRFEPGEQHQIVRHHGGPDVGLEVVQSPNASAPRAKTLSCWHQYPDECPPDETEVHAVSIACRTTVVSHRYK